MKEQKYTAAQIKVLRRLVKQASKKGKRVYEHEDLIVVLSAKMAALGMYMGIESATILPEIVDDCSNSIYFSGSTKPITNKLSDGRAKEVFKIFNTIWDATSPADTTVTYIIGVTAEKITSLFINGACFTIPANIIPDCKSLCLDVKIAQRGGTYMLVGENNKTKLLHVLQERKSTVGE
jgi:hypothetical protein